MAQSWPWGSQIAVKKIQKIDLPPKIDFLKDLKRNGEKW